MLQYPSAIPSAIAGVMPREPCPGRGSTTWCEAGAR